MAFGRAKLGRIGGKGILRLGHADRQRPVALRLPFLQLCVYLRIGLNLGCAIDAAGNGFDLVPKRQVIGIKRRKACGAAVGDLRHALCQRGDPGGPFGPVTAQKRLRPLRGDKIADGGQFRLGIAGEMVDRHHHRHAEAFEVFDMAAQIGAARRHRRHILGAQISARHAAIHLERADRGH